MITIISDLKNKIFQNPGEIGLDNLGRDKRSNGIDDDNNGFIDDLSGWDFTDRVGFPFDSTGGDYLGWDNDPYDDSQSSLASGHGTQRLVLLVQKQIIFLELQELHQMLKS